MTSGEGAVARTGLGAVPDEAFDRFAAMVREILNVPVVVVALADGDREVFPGASGLDETDERQRQAPLSDEPVACAQMPLTDADGQVLGALCAIDRQPRRWTGQELRLLADLAAACSDSLRLRIATVQGGRERRYALRQEQRAKLAYDHSQLLLQASTALAGASSVDSVTDIVRELLTGALDPAYVGLSLLGDPDFFEEAGWQSTVSVPLRGPSGPLGSMNLAWKEAYTVDETEQAVLVALAGYVAQALTRTTVLDDRRTAAAIMQKALLTPLPRHHGVRMAARYVPAHHEDHVGGDWYDAITLDRNRLALVIGDIAGHSITAAAAMSQYRSMLRTLLIDRHEPPSGLLRRLEHTSRALGQPVLATVLLAYLDPEPGGGHTLTWANAGHPAPTVRSPDGHVAALGFHDPLLGALRRPDRRDQSHYLPPGTVLLMHTDGLVETRTATVDEGLAKVHEVLARHGDADPQRLADLLIEHVNPDVREDDVALLVVATPAG